MKVAMKGHEWECPYKDSEVLHPRVSITALFLIVCDLFIERLLCARFLGTAQRQKKPQVLSWRNASFPGEQEAKRAVRQGLQQPVLPRRCWVHRVTAVPCWKGPNALPGPLTWGINPALTCSLRA